MTVPTDETSEWMEAGRRAPLTNSPMGATRFEALTFATSQNARATVVDFGCGQAAFARRVAELNPALRVIGLDTSADQLAYGDAMADEAGLTSRIAFICDEATSWESNVDTAVCIGSSHAFGNTSAMFAHLHGLGARLAVIGDAYWHTEPDAWHLAEFGELPKGLDEVAALAEAAGWTVEDIDASTLDEWDDFEDQWRAGVEVIGTPGALAFANEREAEYQRYRNTLGFAWLQLRRG